MKKFRIFSVILLMFSVAAFAVFQVYIHQVQDTGSNAAQQWRETMAIALADRMAIPMGKSLSDAEMRDLLMRFYENQASQYLTNGQTIFTIITPDEVQKRF